MTIEELNIQVLLLGFIPISTENSNATRYWDKGNWQLSLWENNEYSLSYVPTNKEKTITYITKTVYLDNKFIIKDKKIIATKDPEIVYNIIVDVLTEK